MNGLPKRYRISIEDYGGYVSAYVLIDRAGTGALTPIALKHFRCIHEAMKWGEGRAYSMRILMLSEE